MLARPQTDPIPIVLVQGFLGTPGVFSWDYHVNRHNSGSFGKRKILVASLGPVSSLHDRACELFYSLVGGRVDYGVEHSVKHDHAQFGRQFEDAMYPSWSKEHPLHFVGHSIGGPTIIKMQHLLARGHFGKEYHPDMVLSLNAVCSPFRGTQVTYVLGESTTSAPDVHPISVGAFIAKLTHILAYFAPVLPPILDIHADAHSLSYRDISVAEFLKHLWRSDWAESRDAAPYDMTFEAADDREMALEGKVYPNTFYRSHVSVMTAKATEAKSGSHHHHPQIGFSLTHNALYLTSMFMGSFDFRSLHPRPSFCSKQPSRVTNTALQIEDKLEQAVLPFQQPQGEEYWANDGVVPVFSQWHPLECKNTSCTHYNLQKDQSLLQSKPTEAGTWSVLTTENTNHLSLIPGPFKDDVFQEAFWVDVLAWLNTIETSLT